jgi:SAM-dependent methyltransferase
MDRPTGNVEEVTWRCVENGLASRAGFHPQNTRDHIDRGLVIAVVVPSGDNVRLGPDQTGPHISRDHRLLPPHPRRVVTLDAILRTNQGHRFGSGHAHILAIVSEEDRRHWDERHVVAGVGSDIPSLPTAFARIEDLFPVAGRALEIACGRGEMSVWLAMRGMDVVGVDVSPVAVGLARELADRGGVADRTRFEVWDLDNGLPPGPPIDLVVCHMFREPRLDQELIERVGPSGLIAIASLSEVGGTPGRFRAAPGELREAFAELEILSDGEGDGVAWLLGRKPG